MAFHPVGSIKMKALPFRQWSKTFIYVLDVYKVFIFINNIEIYIEVINVIRSDVHMVFWLGFSKDQQEEVDRNRKENL